MRMKKHRLPAAAPITFWDNPNHGLKSAIRNSAFRKTTSIEKDTTAVVARWSAANCSIYDRRREFIKTPLHLWIFFFYMHGYGRFKIASSSTVLNSLSAFSCENVVLAAEPGVGCAENSYELYSGVRTNTIRKITIMWHLDFLDFAKYFCCHTLLYFFFFRILFQ